MSLVARDVTHVYSAGTSFAATALDGVSLELESGGLALVIGRTGSGKSTLLRVLAGLMQPTGGTVEADGAPLGDAVRGAVAMVFQDAESQLFADTVLEDAAFGPRNLGRSEQEAASDAADALESVGLPPAVFGARSPFSLSGGEARRAALAGVLAMRPRYLLLDEPTAGLDARGRRAVREAVARVREGGVGVVVVSHDADEWLAAADRV
ncbi:MAG: ATP-binding cassette domain-containing protein, partial [Actinobacteria bacterium]